MGTPLMLGIELSQVEEGTSYAGKLAIGPKMYIFNLSIDAGYLERLKPHTKPEEIAKHSELTLLELNGTGVLLNDEQNAVLSAFTVYTALRDLQTPECRDLRAFSKALSDIKMDDKQIVAGVSTEVGIPLDDILTEVLSIFAR